MSEWIYDPRAGRCRKTDGGQAVSDKIAEIRARHMSETWPRLYELKVQIHDDREWLLAEVERLTGKLKLVADALNETISKYHEVGDQNDRLDAENERLRAEIARMKKLHTPPAGIPWPAREEDKS